MRSFVDPHLAPDNRLARRLAANPVAKHVCPGLHESPPRACEARVIVGGSHLVLLLVGEAGFDQGLWKERIVES